LCAWPFTRVAGYLKEEKGGHGGVMRKQMAKGILKGESDMFRGVGPVAGRGKQGSLCTDVW